MKKIKTLLVQFESALKLNQVPAFRGAIIEKVGRDNILFHHHKSEKELLYSYPLIQYKSVNNKSAIFCLGDGVDEIHKLFNASTWEINLKGEKISLKIDRLDLNNQLVNIWTDQFKYNLRNWLGLNAENYKRYTAAEAVKDKVAILEKILTANILAFAKGIQWTIDKPIELSITDLISQKMIKYKGVPLMAFDVAFQCNVSMPNFIGLGKSASHGFGILKKTIK